MKSLIPILFLVSSAWAGPLTGPGAGGGGFVLHCPATPVAPERVTVLDVYEAPSTYQIATASGNLSKDFFEAVDRSFVRGGAPGLAQQRRDAIQRNLVAFFDATTFVNDLRDLPYSNDLGTVPWIPRNCQIEQLAYFDDQSEHIFILKPLFEKLDSLNQAALVEHELMYWAMRTLHDRDSVVARRLVGNVFALSGPMAAKDGLSQNQSLKFIAYPLPDGRGPELSVFYATPLIGAARKPFLRLQFTHLQGRTALSKTWADLPVQRLDLAGEGDSCVVSTPGLDAAGVVALNGDIFGGYSLGFKMKTGEPMVISLIRDNEVLSQGRVSGDSHCQGWHDIHL